MMMNTREDINYWINKYNIIGATINDDLTVDVWGYVDLSNLNLVEIPIQFGTVKGDFFCDRNKLVSLKGTPYHVTGTFYCGMNHLIDLTDAPKIIGYDFNCVQNHLISLGNFNSQINRNFFHNSSSHKIKELEEYYYENIAPNETIFSLTMSGMELNTILLSLQLETELSNNKMEKIKLKI